MRRKLPPLTRIQIARLPAALQQAHAAWTDPPSPGLPVEELRERARGLALSLLELGEDTEATERQLHTWRLHPAIAHEAVAWAVQHREVTQRVARRPPARGDVARHRRRSEAEREGTLPCPLPEGRLADRPVSRPKADRSSSAAGEPVWLHHTGVVAVPVWNQTMSSPASPSRSARSGV